MLANEAFIGRVRDEIRARLLAAARTGKLVYLDGPQVDVFVANGSMVACELCIIVCALPVA